MVLMRYGAHFKKKSVRTEYGEIRSISSYFNQMLENADQNNSEYGQFLSNVLSKKRRDLKLHCSIKYTAIIY